MPYPCPPPARTHDQGAARCACGHRDGQGTSSRHAPLCTCRALRDEYVAIVMVKDRRDLGQLYLTTAQYAELRALPPAAVQ